MAERNEYTITEAGYDAMALVKASSRGAKACYAGPQVRNVTITPAGRAAMRDTELAHATAQGAGQVPGAQPPCRLAAASPERPAAAADFLRR